MSTLGGRVLPQHHQVSRGGVAEPCDTGDSNVFLLRDSELPVVRGQRNHLCDLLGVPRPQLVPKVILVVVPVLPVVLSSGLK